MRPHASRTLSVSKIVDHRTFEVCLETQDLQLLREGAEIHTPMNMHKLCGEIIIPSTTVEERVICIGGQEDVAKLLLELEGDKNFYLRSDVELSNGAKLPAGLVVQGRLSREGFIRRKYWSMGSDRMGQWLTTKLTTKMWECTCEPYVPQDMAEEPVTSREDIQVGTWLVFRRGVSYAEVCNDGQGLRIREFISHNWSESSKDFLATMKAARVSHAWICTIAINQHRIPPLDEEYQRLPFYLALKAVKDYGRVVMAMDVHATTLTRIWCVFECWVAYFLGLRLYLFLPSGELNFWAGNAESADVSAMIEELKLENASSSMPEDKVMISNIIQRNGGMRMVTWQVKRKLSMGAVLFLAVLVSNTSNFLFSLPWISNISRLWFQKTFVRQEQLPFSESLFVYTICFGSAVAHLQYWLLFFRGVRAVSTLRALMRTLSMGAGFAKALGLLAIFELANVFGITLLLIVRDPDNSHWVRIILCEEKGISSCIFMTIYLLQKTLPWIVGWVAYKQGYSINFEEFLPAAPCVGFLITLSCVSLKQWRHASAKVDSPFCDGDGDLSHLRLNAPGDVVLNVLVCGLSAWAISVFQRFAISVFNFLKESHRILQILWWVLVTGVAIVLLTLLLWFHYFHVLWQQSWNHMQIGFAIWLVCWSIWHRHFLQSWLSGFVRNCRINYRTILKRRRQSRGASSSAANMITEIQGTSNRSFSSTSHTPGQSFDRNAAAQA